MRIRVRANHRYIDEIQSVAQIFFPHARFGSDESPEYTIASFFENGKIYAELFNDRAHFTHHTFGGEPVHSLGKYAIDLNDYSGYTGEQFAKRTTSPGCMGEQFTKRTTSPGCMGEQFAKRTTSSLYLNDKRLAVLAMYHLLQNTIGAYAPWGALTGVRPTKMVREWMASGQSDDEIVHDLQNIFCVHKDRAELAVAVASAENRLSGQIQSIGSLITSGVTAYTLKQSPLGLYIGIPFCPSRCIYCSFNTSHKPWSKDAQARYIQAVIAECRDLSNNLQEKEATISSIYIGGGTPTALTDSLLESLLAVLQEIATPIEYTVEAGRPDTITRDNLQIMRKYGVNRISINPQTINDNTLKTIGRKHTTRDFLHAFELAREEGFTSINTDIIAGLPGEGPEDMHHTMETLAALTPENITIHTLAVKRASQLNERRTENAMSNYALPDAKSIGSQLKIAHDGCIAQGLSPYYLYRQKNMAALFENTGYSLPGHECLYNIGMMSEVQTVLGIGAGAVSKYIEGTKITRKFNVKNPEIYINRTLLPT